MFTIFNLRYRALVDETNTQYHTLMRSNDLLGEQINIEDDMKQEVVDYGSVTFHQIQPQDNPAFLDQQCVMIVGSSELKGKFKVLAIVPHPDESVNEVAEFYRHDHAKLFAEQNENWFNDYTGVVA